MLLRLLQISDMDFIMYKGIITTNKGAEEIASLEISELIKCTKIEKEDTIVKFGFTNLIDLCTICYKSQSINRAFLLLSEFKIHKSIEESMREFKKKADKLNFNEWLSKEKSFRVECERTGEHDFHSVDIEIEIGKKIFGIIEKKYNYKQKTDFNNPDVVFFLYIINDKGYFGVDFSGFELSKRQYKIFNHPEALKGITGYFLVREAGYRESLSVLDPFMGSGIIVIEAGLFALKFPVQYYNKEKLFFTNFDFFKKFGQEKFFKEHDSKIKDIDTKVFGYDGQLRYLKATQKNAKLAGIDKNINLSKCEIEWLDTKFEKNSIDLIVTDPPRTSKNRDNKKTLKIYNEFFYQADYILKKKGQIVLLCKEIAPIKDAAIKHKFNIKKEYTLNQGKEIFNVLVFMRG